MSFEPRSLSSPLPGPRSSRGTARILLLFLLVTAGCSTAPPATSASEPASSASGASGASGAAAEGSTSETAEAAAAQAERGSIFGPPVKVVGVSDEEEWLVDEDGQRYYTVEVVREPWFKILPNGAVLLPPGAAFELVEEGEETLVVKIYEERERPARRREAEDRSAVIADLRAAAVPTGDRIRFAPFGSGLPERGQWRQGFELTDIDGDGHLDIVHGPPRKGDGQPRIFLGDGQGRWRPWRQATFEADRLDYGDVGVADFDGDGHLDLAFAVHLRGLQVLRGDGNGTFRRAWEEDLPYEVAGEGGSPGSYSSRAVEVVDWNRDGRPDLLTVAEGPRLARSVGKEGPEVSRGERGPVLFLNRGPDGWERYDQGTGREKIFADDVAVGDFDGDGLHDFAVASRVRGATTLVKMGRADGTWEDVALGDLVRRALYSAVHAADLDGDGRDELLLGYALPAPGDGEPWSGIDLLDLEDGRWARSVVAAKTGLEGVTALAAGDLDGDGRPDVVGLTGGGERWVLLATDEGFLDDRSTELAPRSEHCQGYHAEVVPIGEGETLLVMGFAGESGSEQLIPGLAKRCTTKGSLEAWKVVRER